MPYVSQNFPTDEEQAEMPNMSRDQAIRSGIIQTDPISAAAYQGSEFVRVPAGQRAQSKKPDPKDYPELFGDDDVKPTQTAGPAVADSKPKAKDYAELFEDTGTGKPSAAPAQSSVQPGLFSGVPGFIREHPYASGALAAVLAAPVLALAPEVGLPVAGALMGLLRNRAIQTGTGIALGQQLGPRASEGLHYLLRLSGIEGE